MTKKTTIREAIQTMGHLLETNSHVGATAADRFGQEMWRCDSRDACRWCLVGAEMLTGEYLLGNYYHKGLDRAVRKLLDDPRNKPTEWIWEGPGTSNKTRKQIIKKLKNA
jgi:hypothetical protein